MTPNICQYIRYCLFLFDHCTVNGLGRFEVNEVPPRSDHNGNLLKSGKYFIVLKPAAEYNSRLSVVISSRENCTEDQAEGMIAGYVQNVWTTIQAKKEFWLTQLGMLTAHNGELRLMSLTYKAEELTSYLADPFSSPKMPAEVVKTPVAHAIAPNKFITVEEPSTMAAFAMPAQALSTNRLLQPQIVTALAPRSDSGNAIALQRNIFEQSLSRIYAIKRKHIRVAAVALLIAIGSSVLIAFLPKSFSLGKQTTATASPEEKSASLLSNPLEDTDETPSDAYTDQLIAKPSSKPLANKTKKPATSAQAEQQPENNSTLSGNSIDNQSSLNVTQPVAALTVQKLEPAQPAPVLVEEKKVISESTVTLPASSTGATDSKTEKQPEKSKPTTAFIAARPVNQRLSVSEYLRRNIRYPEYEQYTEGSCIAEFVISKSGDIVNVNVLHSLGAAFDNEIRRVARTLPKLLPATENGEPTESTLQIKVGFVYVKERP